MGLALMEVENYDREMEELISSVYILSIDRCILYSVLYIWKFK